MEDEIVLKRGLFCSPTNQPLRNIAILPQLIY
jgi:hypothetical protein